MTGNKSLQRPAIFVDRSRTLHRGNDLKKVTNHNFQNRLYKPYSNTFSFSQTTPFFNNRGASVLGGALGGLGAASKMGGGMNDFGTWALGGLGALGGLL